MPKCKICKKKFSSLTALSDHHKSVHRSVRFAAPSSNTDFRKFVTLIIIIVIAASVIGYLAISSSLASSSSHGGSGALSAWVGRRAPSFSLSEVNGSGTFTLSNYASKSNVLLFFNEGLDCSPCLQQMQDLSNDYASFKALNVVVACITTDSASSLYQWTQANQVNNIAVLSDSGLTVSNLYNALGSNVSMMSGRDGHTFILVSPSGVIKWRADYGPGTMFVPDSQILTNVKQALTTASISSSSSSSTG